MVSNPWQEGVGFRDIGRGSGRFLPNGLGEYANSPGHTNNEKRCGWVEGKAESTVPLQIRAGANLSPSERILPRIFAVLKEFG